MMSLQPLFVYGTLMAPEVIQTLIGRAPIGRPARLVDPTFRRHPVRNCVYPGLIRRTSAETTTTTGGDRSDTADGVGVTGILYHDLSHDEMVRLDLFEGDDYTKESCVVQLLPQQDGVGKEPCDAIFYLWARPVCELDVEQSWSYETFRQQHLATYVQNTVRSYRDETDTV